jgi:hypothetical protein
MSIVNFCQFNPYLPRLQLVNYVFCAVHFKLPVVEVVMWLTRLPDVQAAADSDVPVITLKLD